MPMQHANAQTMRTKLRRIESDEGILSLIQAVVDTCPTCSQRSTHYGINAAPMLWYQTLQSHLRRTESDDTRMNSVPDAASMHQVHRQRLVFRTPTITSDTESNSESDEDCDADSGAANNRILADSRRRYLCLNPNYKELQSDQRLLEQQCPSQPCTNQQPQSACHHREAERHLSPVGYATTDTQAVARRPISVSVGEYSMGPTIDATGSSANTQMQSPTPSAAPIYVAGSSADIQMQLPTPSTAQLQITKWMKPRQSSSSISSTHSIGSRCVALQPPLGYRPHEPDAARELLHFGNNMRAIMMIQGQHAIQWIQYAANQGPRSMLSTPSATTESRYFSSSSARRTMRELAIKVFQQSPEEAKISHEMRRRTTPMLELTTTKMSRCHLLCDWNGVHQCGTHIHEDDTRRVTATQSTGNQPVFRTDHRSAIQWATLDQSSCSSPTAETPTAIPPSGRIAEQPPQEEDHVIKTRSPHPQGRTGSRDTLAIEDDIDSPLPTRHGTGIPIPEETIEHRPPCQCRCDCVNDQGKRRRPGRRILCNHCGNLVGPGCCWNPPTQSCHMCVSDIGREEFTDLINDKLQPATVDERACSAFPAEAGKKAMHEGQALGVFDTVGDDEDIGNERDEILQHEQTLLEEMPLPGTGKGKAERRQKWLKLPRPTRAAIRRMHLQFGHLPKQPLYELLKAAKCPPEYLEASKHFKRDTCSRSQHLPKQTQKVSPPKSHLRSPAARIIGFEAPAYQHLHDHADQMPRGEQQAYDDESHLAPDPEDESGSDDERHVEEVPVGRQEVESDPEGEKIEGTGLPMDRRDKRQRELLDDFPAEAFKPTELRAGPQTPPPTPAPTELRADRSRSPTRATNHREVEQLDMMDVGDHPGSLLGAWNRTATSGAGVDMLRRRHDNDAVIAFLTDSRLPVPVVKGYQKQNVTKND
jgi:hypothetical protein